MEYAAEGSLLSGSFRLKAVVRGLLTAIVVIIWLTALATALQTRTIQPVGVAMLATVIGWARHLSSGAAVERRRDLSASISDPNHRRQANR